VFAACVELKDSGPCVQLSVNAVRRARRDALLGYCRPTQLIRGLSLSSIRKDGGPVFGARVRILYSTPMMVKLSTTDAVLVTNAASTGPRQVTISNEEYSIISHYRTDNREKEIERLTKLEEFGLSALLEDCGCDDELTKLILRIENENYGESEFEESTKREIDRMKQKVQMMRMTKIQEYLDDAACAVKVSGCFTDALVEGFDGCLAWIRITTPSEQLQDSSGSQSTANFTLGSCYFATNMKLVSSNGFGNAPLFGTSTNSSFHCLSGNIGRFPNRPRSTGLSITTVNMLLDEPKQKCYHGQELTLIATVVDHYTNTNNRGQQSAAITVVDILLMDSTNSDVLLLFKYAVPSELITNMVKSWLVAQAIIRVEHAVVLERDELRRIITLGRGDRTIIQLISNVESPQQTRGPLGGNQTKKGALNTPSRRAKSPIKSTAPLGNLAQQIQVSCPKKDLLLENVQRMSCMEESIRYRSLRENADYFVVNICDSEWKISCSKSKYRSSQLRLACDTCRKGLLSDGNEREIVNEALADCQRTHTVVDVSINVGEGCELRRMLIDKHLWKQATQRFTESDNACCMDDNTTDKTVVEAESGFTFVGRPHQERGYLNDTHTFDVVCSEVVGSGSPLQCARCNSCQLVSHKICRLL
jgi:hypothetical protein